MNQDNLMHPFLRSHVTSTFSSKLISLTEVVLMTSWRIMLNMLFSVGPLENCTLAKSPDVTQWGEHAYKHICKMAGRRVSYYHLNSSTLYCWTEKKKIKDTSFCSESDRKCHAEYSNTVLFQLRSSYVRTEEEVIHWFREKEKSLWSSNLIWIAKIMH